MVVAVATASSGAIPDPQPPPLPLEAVRLSATVLRQRDGVPGAAHYSHVTLPWQLFVPGSDGDDSPLTVLTGVNPGRQNGGGGQS